MAQAHREGRLQGTQSGTSIDRIGSVALRPIATMNNAAWETARTKAGLGDLHVHDLRHTVGMRLREAAVPKTTISDLLWHATKDMTDDYSVAQLQGLTMRSRKSVRTQAAESQPVDDQT